MNFKPSTSTGLRSRAPNFTREEQELLCDVLKPYMHIVESKKTDCVKHGDKQAAWAKVTEAFNANTKHVNRTTENLLLCYRNMKAKIKKNHSNAKMNLSDPTKKEAFINAIEAHSNDLNAISLAINEPVEVCASGFKTLQKEIKRKESKYKKSIMGTGGGPPSADNDEPLMKLKKIIEPQIDGLFTIYDGDSELMAQFQETLPDSEKIKPIELGNEYEMDNVLITTIDEPILSQEENIVSTPLSRVNLLRKKKATPLDTSDNDRPPRKEKTNAAFIKLAEQKLELVKIQKQILEKELQIKELELQDKVKENKHKELMREKELLLLNMKINNLK